MSKHVNHRPVTAEAQAWSQASPCGNFSGHSGHGKGFCPRTSVSPVSVIPPLLHTLRLFIGHRHYTFFIFVVPCIVILGCINPTRCNSMQIFIWCGWFWAVFVLQAEACNTGTTQNQTHQSSNTQRTENKTTDVVIHQHSRKLLMMDILMSETCWAHKKWNKIASDIRLVFHSSTITMMHGPINVSNIRGS